MKQPISTKTFLKGLAGGAVSIAVLFALQFGHDHLPQIAYPAASSGAELTAADASGGLTPGTYTASADGFGGDVTVTLTVDENGGISEVELVGSSETPDVGGAALDALREQILAAQSAEIDGVSGASLTSGAVKTAAAAAIAEASGEAAEASPTP